MNIFGGNTGVSYDDIKRQRAIAERLVAAQTRNGPRNVGEGLTAIGNALAARSLSKKAESKSAELDAQWAESAGGMGIDPARMEIIKNLPYDQRQAYMLSYMDKQDALKRRGSGGSGKADAQAALVAQLLGGGAEQPAAPAQPAVSGFDMAQDITGQAPMQMPDFAPGVPVEQTPMLDQKGMTPTQGDFNNELIAQYAQPQPAVAPVAQAGAGMTDMTAPIGQTDITDMEQYLAQAGQQPAPQQAPAAAPQQAPAPMAAPQPELSFGTPAEPQAEPMAAPQQSQPQDPYADQRAALTSDIDRLYDMLSNPAINSQTKKAVLDAIKIKDAQFKRLPEAPKDLNASRQAEYDFIIQNGGTHEQAMAAVADIDVFGATGPNTDSQDSTVSIIDRILASPEGIAGATGAIQGNLDPNTMSGGMLLGAEAKAILPYIEQLQGKSFLEAYQSLKGGGPITDIEGKKATDAHARLQRYTDSGTFTEALLELSYITDRRKRRELGETVEGYDQGWEKYKKQYFEKNKTPAPASRPGPQNDADDVPTWNPETGVWE